MAKFKVHSYRPLDKGVVLGIQRNEEKPRYAYFLHKRPHSFTPTSYTELEKLEDIPATLTNIIYGRFSRCSGTGELDIILTCQIGKRQVLLQGAGMQDRFVDPEEK